MYIHVLLKQLRNIQYNHEVGSKDIYLPQTVVWRDELDFLAAQPVWFYIGLEREYHESQVERCPYFDMRLLPFHFCDSWEESLVLADYFHFWLLALQAFQAWLCSVVAQHLWLMVIVVKTIINWEKIIRTLRDPVPDSNTPLSSNSDIIVNSRLGVLTRMHVM